MKSIIKIINDRFIIISNIGIFSYLKYVFLKKGDYHKILIKGVEIYVRKGTPDLYTAISCFNGEFEILRNYFPEDFRGNIIDAGGYIGTSAISLHRIFPLAKIIIIEPSLDNLKILKQNVYNYENIKIIHGALVGSKIKTIDLKNRGTGEWGFSVVNKPKDNFDSKILHETPAYRLKDLINSIGAIDIIKLDIEGGEFDIMQNDLNSLEKIPAVFAELHDYIIDGCSELFFNFSNNRVLIKDKGEKYLSVARSIDVQS